MGKMRKIPSPVDVAEINCPVCILRNVICAATTGRELFAEICSRTVPSRAAVVSACSRGMRLGGAGSEEIFADPA
jgi:hypothetical protein